MNRSETISELAKALNAFQAVVAGAKKDSKNPFYHSKYADLASIWKTIREPLTANGLSVTQLPVYNSDPNTISIETVLMHNSGEWISGVITLNLVIQKKDKDGDVMQIKNDPQSAGSAITYARRYGLSAILGIHQEDDDANTMTQQTKALPPRKPADATIPTVKPTNAPTPNELSYMRDRIRSGIKKLAEAGIDGFDIDKRVKRSIKSHLGEESLDKCKDKEALSAYIDVLIKKFKDSKSPDLAGCGSGVWLEDGNKQEGDSK